MSDSESYPTAATLGAKGAPSESRFRTIVIFLIPLRESSGARRGLLRSGRPVPPDELVSEIFLDAQEHVPIVRREVPDASEGSIRSDEFPADVRGGGLVDDELELRPVVLEVDISVRKPVVERPER